MSHRRPLLRSILPAKLCTNEKIQRQTLMLVSTLVSLVLGALAFLSIGVIVDHSLLTSYGKMICAGIAYDIGVFLYFRWRLQAISASVLLLLRLNLSILYLCFASGAGLHSGEYMWFAILPVFSSFLLGIWGGFLTVTVILLQTAALMAWNTRLSSSSLYTSGSFIGELAVRGAALIFITILSAAYEYGRQLDRRCYEEANQRLSEANERLQHATAAKIQFLANISHELRTPLHGIIAMSAELREMRLDERAQDNVAIICDSADHLLTLVTDVLDFEQIESGKLELERIPFNVVEEAHRVVRMLSTSAGRKRLRLDGHNVRLDQPIRIGDPVRFRQVLFNLVSNAIKFTPEGGRVAIFLGVATPAGVDCTASGPEASLPRPPTGGDRLEVSVVDTGIGIPQKAIPKLFEGFTQVDMSSLRRHGGSGLGLAISRRLVEMMDGTIWCLSEVGKGSCFTFNVLLPAAEQQLVESAAEPPSAVAPVVHTDEADSLAGRAVLLVEDNIVNQKVALRMLASFGCRSVVAENGLIALQILEKQRFDVVLLDIQMPVLDGFQCAIRIRELEREKWSAEGRPRLPVIALSAAATPEYKRRGAECGMDMFLTKPLRKEILRDAMRSALALMVVKEHTRDDQGIELTTPAVEVQRRANCPLASGKR